MVMHISIPEEKCQEKLLPPDVEVTRLKKRDYKIALPDDSTASLRKKYNRKRRILLTMVIVMAMGVCVVTFINFMLARSLIKQKQENAQLLEVQKMMEMQQMESFMNSFSFPDFGLSNFFGGNSGPNFGGNELIIFTVEDVPRSYDANVP